MTVEEKKELTSRQRAFLRSEAHSLHPLVMVGRDGVNDAVAAALAEAAERHELVKVKFQAHKDEAKQLSAELASLAGCTLVSVTGFTALYYKQNADRSKRIYDLKTLSVNEDNL